MSRTTLSRVPANWRLLRPVHQLDDVVDDSSNSNQSPHRRCDGLVLNTATGSHFEFNHAISPVCPSSIVHTRYHHLSWSGGHGQGLEDRTRFVWRLRRDACEFADGPTCSDGDGSPQPAREHPTFGAVVQVEAGCTIVWIGCGGPPDVYELRARSPCIYLGHFQELFLSARATRPRPAVAATAHAITAPHPSSSVLRPQAPGHV